MEIKNELIITKKLLKELGASKEILVSFSEAFPNSRRGVKFSEVVDHFITYPLDYGYFVSWLFKNVPENETVLVIDKTYIDSNIYYNGSVHIKNNLSLDKKNRIYAKGRLKVDGNLFITENAEISAFKINVKNLKLTKYATIFDSFLINADIITMGDDSQITDSECNIIAKTINMYNSSKIYCNSIRANDLILKQGGRILNKFISVCKIINTSGKIHTYADIKAKEIENTKFGQIGVQNSLLHITANRIYNSYSTIYGYIRVKTYENDSHSVMEEIIS